MTQLANAAGQPRLAWPARWLRDPLPYGLALALITLLGASLRLYGIGSRSLDFDEGATSYFAHLPLADLWGPPARLETNPPLFYTIEHVLALLLGNDAATLRLPSVVAGSVCVPVAALIARWLGGQAASLAAALLVATSPVIIASSEDARAYSALTLAALVAIAAELWLLEAYRRPIARNGQARLGAWAAYTGASGAALFLHNTEAVMVASLNLVAALWWVSVLKAQRRFAIHWTAANAVVLMLYAVWLPIVAYQSTHTLAEFWIAVPTVADLRYAMMNAYAQPYARLLQPLPDFLFLAAGLAGVVFHKSNRVVLALAIFVLLGVPVLSWLISQWRPIMNGKTLLWVVPIFLIFVALGCTRFRSLACPLTALLVMIQAVACHGYFQTRWDEAFPEVAAVLRAMAEDGDAIYLDSQSEQILLSYYGWPRERLRVYAPYGPDPWFRGFDGTTLTAANAERLGHVRRLWVLTRQHAVEHRVLARKLSGTMAETFDSNFGHGLLRNLALRNLELSLFEANAD
jgi:mannosyltransferase